jgi:large subunit ribosomal protein L25
MAVNGKTDLIFTGSLSKLVGGQGGNVKDLKLEATKRDVLGKKTRFLRRQGITPAHLFGHGIESVPLECNTAVLEKIVNRAGTTRLVSLVIPGDDQPRKVFIREIQIVATTGALIHVDLYQVSLKERMKVEVPIVLVGEARALRGKGRILIKGVDSLNIECLPDKVPPQIEVDLSPLVELDQALHVSDIVLDPDITLFTDPGQLVVKVVEMKAEKAEEVAPKLVAEEVKAEEEGEAPAAEAKPETPA